MRKSQRTVASPQKQRPAPLFFPVSRNGRPHKISSLRTNPQLEARVYECDADLTTPEIRRIFFFFFFLKREPGPEFLTRSERSKPAYLVIFETTPEPTVRPPSRIAKRRPSSMAIGAISLTLIVTLSPGITISVPSGRITSPVTSVVRK